MFYFYSCTNVDTFKKFDDLTENFTASELLISEVHY